MRRENGLYLNNGNAETSAGGITQAVGGSQPAEEEQRQKLK